MDTLTLSFILIPGRTNAEICSPTGKNIDRVDHLHQNGRVAINHAGDQDTEIDFFS
jgi:hypothetical protein